MDVLPGFVLQCRIMATALPLPVPSAASDAADAASAGGLEMEAMGRYVNSANHILYKT